MPVYVYRNLRTAETFEVEQRIAEPALTEHPESGDPIKRLIQPVGIAFKGSGFYVTDSRKSSGPGAGKSGEKGDGLAEGKSESKSEGKSESKSEGKSELKSEGKSESKSEGKSSGSPASSESKGSSKGSSAKADH
ncbi:MAG: hypothetical protein WD273_14830 [Trueperaceae bacterium]